MAKIDSYCRVSTDDGDQTLEQQQAEITAAYPPGTEFRWYGERISGWQQARRPEYDLLRKNIQKGWVKELAVFSISRLGRNVQEAARLLDQCQQLGVRVKVLNPHGQRISNSIQG